MISKGSRFFGLTGGGTGWLLGSFLPKNPRIIVICKDRSHLETLFEDLAFFDNETPILNLTGWDTLPFEEVSADVSVTASRINTIFSLRTLKKYIALISPEALFYKSLNGSNFTSLSLTLNIGLNIKRNDLVSKLDLCGFTRVSSVEHLGEYAIRGSVVDIFPSNYISTDQNPIRIQFDDDQIYSIKYFSIDDQRTTINIDSILILPVKELISFNSNIHGQNQLSDAIFEIKARGKFLETPPREIARAMSALRSFTHLPGIELIQAIAKPFTDTIFDISPDDTLWVVQDFIAIQQFLEEFSDQIESRYNRLASEHRLIPEKSAIFHPLELINQDLLIRNPVQLDSLNILEDKESTEVINIPTKSVADISTRIKASRIREESEKVIAHEVNNLRNQGLSICLAVGSDSRAKRLQKILQNSNIECIISSYSALDWLNHPYRPSVSIVQGRLSQGFILFKENAAFIAEHEIFSEKSYKKQKQSTFNLKRILQSLSKLTEGDYVVHSDYGIGIYKGLKHFQVEGGEGDFLNIEYADSTLYLPVQNIARVQKFSAQEGQTPSIDKLASTKWIKTKAKVRESVATLAGDLIRLYAARSVAKGWRFEPWGADDEQFAESFPYSETPDQQKAIEESIQDMSQDRAMDRLVCGDVGFGKTEVAIRAAFKCVRHKRQVAVLVPTTILAEQHKKNFQERFKDYPINIECISRFNTDKQNKAILERLYQGKVDILIGTHRLLSKDVQFEDIGLLIIDEEHRFGVKQKEKLKSIKKSVDVLTLTATPIPRTLHMSLLGIRDISVIQTPPLDRRTIRTYVANHDNNLVRDAILREIQRGGQAFYLHNRVQSIDLVMSTLKDLVPEARFRFAHGQMSETQLEEIMQNFIDHKFDVLISTTIIESGIDIPNANTLIVERADTFGLAQLYQIRGRVGRSTRQAYAYLLVPKTKNLTSDARRRLSALQSLDELGLGFNLAMQDLEIRGAGNLLGKEQSGSVLAVGFDLYTKILKEAVLNLKGEDLDLSETIDPEVKLQEHAFIPDWYIPDVSERLILYQRLSGIESDADMNIMSEEILDRFGPIPKEVRALLYTMHLRGLLRIYGITKLEIVNSALILHLSKRSPVDLTKILELCKKQPNNFRLGKNLALSIKILSDRSRGAEDTYPIVNELLTRIKAPPNRLD